MKHVKSGKKKSRHKSGLRLGAFWIAMPATILLVLLALAGGGLAYAARLEEQDAFCASCHTQPETTFFERTQAQTQTDLASYHHTQDTRCIDCHSGPGFTGRSAAMMLGASDLFHFVTGTAKQPAPLTVPVNDSHCLKCHQDVPNTRDFNRHFHAFLSRWQSADPNAASCVDCHQAHNTNGQADLVFLETQTTRDVCQHCHAAIRS